MPTCTRLPVHSSEAWKSSEEHRMKVAAETGWLPSCVTAGHTAGGAMAVAVAEYSVLLWHECPYECVLSQQKSPLCACTCFSLGLHCGGASWAAPCTAARGLAGMWDGRWLCMVPITAALTWQGVMVRGRAHGRKYSERQESLHSLLLLVQMCSLLLLIIVIPHSAEGGIWFPKMKCLLQTGSWRGGFVVIRHVWPFDIVTWSLRTECFKWVYSFVLGHIPSYTEACMACKLWFRHVR